MAVRDGAVYKKLLLAPKRQEQAGARESAALMFANYNMYFVDLPSIGQLNGLPVYHITVNL